MKKIAIVPTLFTLANGVCGFASVTLAARVVPDVPTEFELHWLEVAGWLILAAMAFDVVDGYMARFAKSTTDFGGQLDSLCDAISFGVAPAFLLLRMSEGFRGPLWVIAVLFVLCVVLRLARFNCERTHELSGHLIFRGLPSPAAAGTIAAFSIMAPHLVELPALADLFQPIFQLVLPLLVILLSLLMVSRIPYPHVVNQMLRGYHSFGHLVRLLFAGVAVILIRELALPLLFVYFALGAPMRHFWDELVRRRPREEPLF